MRTLLCVLDWGLGHASRSLALAKQLESAGDQVFFASCGRAKAFLAQERPGTIVYELPAYRVTYPTAHMPFNVALQLPRWLLTIAREYRRTGDIARELGIERIISDSRFGCYVPGIPTVLLTHQLHPIFNCAPMSWAYTRYLQRFDAYWVPDTEDRRLSGQLSSPDGYQNVKFIGPLSRLEPKKTAIEKQWKSLSLLSGPEPMRSRLEDILLAQLADIPGRHLLVRGIPTTKKIEETGNISCIDFANAAFLETHLPAADYLICRSGYSTLMDLAVLGLKNAILIPTPGQTEQEYLARTQVQGKEAIAMFSQSAIDLSAVIR